MNTGIPKKMWKEQGNLNVHVEKVHLKGITAMALTVMIL
jgi:hypothetical protein